MLFILFILATLRYCLLLSVIIQFPFWFQNLFFPLLTAQWNCILKYQYYSIIRKSNCIQEWSSRQCILACLFLGKIIKQYFKYEEKFHIQFIFGFENVDMTNLFKIERPGISSPTFAWKDLATMKGIICKSRVLISDTASSVKILISFWYTVN